MKTCEKLISALFVIFTIILTLIVRHEHKINFQKKKSKINISMDNVYMTKFNIGIKYTISHYL